VKEYNKFKVKIEQALMYLEFTRALLCLR
jgi:hypothetical protein